MFVHRYVLAGMLLLAGVATAAPIRGTTAAPVLLPDWWYYEVAGRPLGRCIDMSIYSISRLPKVNATKFPATSPNAICGSALPSANKNVVWLVDGDDRAMSFRYDHDADGDLTDEQVYPMTRTGGQWTATVTAQAPGGVEELFAVAYANKALVVKPMRLHRGTITVDGRAMAFAVIAEIRHDAQAPRFVAFDLDRDGKLAIRDRGSLEVFREDEQYVNIGRTSYRFAIDNLGITLEPVAARPPRPSLVVGSVAPVFTAETFGGDVVDLRKLRGKQVILEFWSTELETCQREQPRLEQLLARRPAVVLLGIDDGANTNGAPGLQLRDTADIQLGELYRIDRWPLYFLIDRAGIIRCARCTFAEIEKLVR